MPRSPRIHYSGAIYHVTARGNNRETIFGDDDDRKYYLKLLAKYKEKFCFFIYAYALMDNHVHLLLEVGSSPLSDIMQGLQQAFTQHINRKYKRVGHVFQQRYHASLCNKDIYLLSIVKYIHDNPRKAGVVKDLNYPWSSHRHYLTTTSLLVDHHVILSFLSEKYEQAIKKYQELMEEPDCVSEQSAYRDLTMQDYGKELVTAVEPATVTLEKLLKTVVRHYGLQEEEFIKGGRSRKIVEVRKLIVYLALKLHIGNGNEIAAALGIHPSQVSRNYYEVAENENLIDEINIFICNLKVQ